MPRSRYNELRLNEGHFNGGYLGEAVNYSTDLVVFDGFSLADGTIMTVTDLLDSAPEREILEGNTPRHNGMYVNGDYWRKKEIEVKGIVKRSTITLLESYLDTLKKSLRKREQYLDITRKDGATTVSVRRHVATLVNPEELFAERQRYHTTICPFTARFRVHNPFAHDRDYTVVSETFSTSPTSKFVESTGTVEGEPIIILLFDAASSVTVVNLKRVDPATGDTLEEIEYSGTVAAGDWIGFDSETKTVKKNGTEVQYTGSFPLVAPGGNLFKFTITGTSFSAIATLKHKTAYL